MFTGALLSSLKMFTLKFHRFCFSPLVSELSLLNQLNSAAIQTSIRSVHTAL